MKDVRVQSWHYQLYLEAYASPARIWVDRKTFIPAEPPKDWPEVEAYRAIQKEERLMYEGKLGREWTEDDSRRYQEATQAYNEAYKKWEEEELAKYSVVKAEEVRQRLEARQVSLCPYFWGVVRASISYRGLIPFGKLIDRILHRLAPWAERTVWAGILAMFIGILGCIGYVIVQELPSPSEMPVVIAREVQELKKERAYQAERKRLIEQEKIEAVAERKAWEAAHPREALAEKLAEQRQARENRSRMWIGFWQNLGGLLVTGFMLLAWVVGIVVAIFGGGFVMYWLCQGVGALFVTFFRLVKRPLTGTRTAALREFWKSFRSFLKDTGELIFAYLKARYHEHLCPFLNPVNDEKN